MGFGEASEREHACGPNGVADRIVNQRRCPFAETRLRPARNDLTRLPFVTSRATVAAAGDKKSRRASKIYCERASADAFPPRGNYP